MKTSYLIPLVCLAISGARATEVKREDLTGTWRCTFIDGRPGADPGKFVMHLREDGTHFLEDRTATEENPAEKTSWYLANIDATTQVLLLDSGGGEDFETMVITVEKGVMTWTPFVRRSPDQPLKPADKVTYRFEKIEK